MHSWFVLLLFGSLLVQILSRPQPAEYNNDSDVEEEEDNESAAEEFLTDDDDSRLAEQESAVQEEEVARNRHLFDLTESRYLQRNTADDHLARTENLSDSKISRNRETRDENAGAHIPDLNEHLQSYPKCRQSSRYIESNDDQQEATQHLTNRDVNKSNRISQEQGEAEVNKRNVEFEGPSNEEGDMIFEKNKDQISKVDKNEYNNNEASDNNEQSRYFKQYYNTLQAENRDMIEEKGHDGARFNLRDRRDTKEANPADIPNMSSGKESNDKTDSEDEESAIKRHIKKLSGDELDQLLNSLTEEKRELLKKIIDDVDGSDNGFISKREITKKAGAVEENNFIENCQSDLSKVQGGSPVLELNTEASPTSSVDTTELNKQAEGVTESNDISSSKSGETSMGSESKIALTSHIEEAIQKKADNSLNNLSLNIDPKSQGEIVANVQVTSKTENKRETNLNDLEGVNFEDPKMSDSDTSLQNGQDYGNEQGPQEENLSNLLEDDEPQFHQDSKEYKRETYLEKQAELSDSMKSLEESFPNSNAYDDSVPYSGPLVRVKRKNCDQVIKKRAAGLLPDAKVGYFPYKAENEDEDNDEGNEFDDEGFYDRTSNFANNNKALEEETANADNSVQVKNSNVDDPKAPHENLKGDTMSLGSDTDSVLSGVEGVDDNLMYSSGTRKRRTAEEIPSDTPEVKTERSTSLLESEMKSASESYFNAPHYQENDAFGPLPRSYDGDLARYKRIRRVKESHNAQDITSSDG